MPFQSKKPEYNNASSLCLWVSWRPCPGVWPHAFFSKLTVVVDRTIQVSPYGSLLGAQSSTPCFQHMISTAVYRDRHSLVLILLPVLLPQFGRQDACRLACIHSFVKGRPHASKQPGYSGCSRLPRISTLTRGAVFSLDVAGQQMRCWPPSPPGVPIPGQHPHPLY